MAGGADGSRALPGAVLFACTMNSVRSPMAAAILGHLTGRRVVVSSAGVRPGQMDPFVIVVMREIGIDLSRHRPRGIDEIGDESYDLVVSLSPEAHHKALELTRTMACDVEFWPTLDATVLAGHRNREQTLAEYRRVRDGLFTRIKERFAIEGSPAV